MPTAEFNNLRNIWDNGRPTGSLRMQTYSNREVCLPQTRATGDGGTAALTYTEFYLKQGQPGQHRLVKSDRGMYYVSTNHYAPGSWCRLAARP
jgi:hypothetical protein